MAEPVVGGEDIAGSIERTLLSQGVSMLLSSALGVAIPGIGFLIGYALSGGLGKLFGQGGPKGGGYAESGDTGTFTQLYGGTGTDRAFTPNTGDSYAKNATSSEEAQYKADLAALGGTGDAQFALGFDTDPQGSAQNRITAGVEEGGKAVYDIKDWSVGRDTGTLTSDISLTEQRQLLAALQASNLPPAAQKALAGLDPNTATLAQIASVEKTAGIPGSSTTTPGTTAAPSGPSAAALSNNSPSLAYFQNLVKTAGGH